MLQKRGHRCQSASRRRYFGHLQEACLFIFPLTFLETDSRAGSPHVQAGRELPYAFHACCVESIPQHHHCA